MAIFSDNNLNLKPKEEIMKQLKKDLKALTRDLNKLTQKTDRMIKQLEKLGKSPAVKKPKAKATQKAVPKKARRLSASDTVLAIIKKSRKGIDTATLRKKTGFNDNKMRGIVYRLKKQGKIKKGGRGIYMKA